MSYVLNTLKLKRKASQKQVFTPYGIWKMCAAYLRSQETWREKILQTFDYTPKTGFQGYI